MVTSTNGSAPGTTRKSRPRLGKTLSSVFHRLANGDTFATSANRKHISDRKVAAAATKKPKANPRTNTTTTKKSTNNVYSRLTAPNSRKTPAAARTTTPNRRRAGSTGGGSTRGTPSRTQTTVRPRSSAARSSARASGPRPKSAQSTRSKRSVASSSKLQTSPTTVSSRKSITSRKSRSSAVNNTRAKTAPIIPTLTRNKSEASHASSISSKSNRVQEEIVAPPPTPRTVDPPSIAIRKKLKFGRRESSILHGSFLGLGVDIAALGLDDDDDDDLSDDDEEKDVVFEDDLDPSFESCYTPDEMRYVALVAHTHMKEPMRKFAIANKNLLRKFRLTGSRLTMEMLHDVYGDDPEICYGPIHSSGPIGGNAELVGQMCTEKIGACIFFQDPMSAHPHVADVECLLRQSNVHNIIMMPNPSSAYACMTTLRLALEGGRAELIPSFFETLVSPSVDEYRMDQAAVLKSNMEEGQGGEEEEDEEDDEPY